MILALASLAGSTSSAEGCETWDKTWRELVRSITFQLRIFAVKKFLFSLKKPQKAPVNKLHRRTCISCSVSVTHPGRSTIIGAIFKNASRYLGKIVVADHTSYSAERTQNLVVKDRVFWGETDSTSAHEQKTQISTILRGQR